MRIRTAQQVMDLVGNQLGLVWLEDFWRDLIFGSRMLRINLLFTGVAVLTLALGIGANSAIFSLVNWLLVRPLAAVDPERLVYFAFQPKNSNEWNNGFSFPELADIRSQSRAAFSDIAGDQSGQMMGLTINGVTQRVWVDFVTSNFFELLGLQPGQGSLAFPSDQSETSSPPVLVLSNSFWKNHLSSDPGIVGKPAFVNGRSVIVIGVTSPGFAGLSSWSDTQVYVPIGMLGVASDGNNGVLADREARNLTLIGRLNGSANPKTVQPLMDLIGSRLDSQRQKPVEGINLRAFRLGPSGPSGDPPADPLPKLAGLFLLLAGLVLVLACINVANLILVRGTARSREIAIRSALGAKSERLIRQLLAESLLISLLGGITGTTIGIIAILALAKIQLGPGIPFVIQPQLDWRVFTYTLVLLILTTLMVGFAPAFRSSRTALTAVMHKDSSIHTDKRQRIRGIIVVCQVAMSLALLIVAGLFARSMAYVEKVDLGFDSRNVINLTLDPHEIGYAQAPALGFYNELLQRVRGLPGVESASLAALVPMGNEVDGDDVHIPGYQPTDPSKNHARYNAISSSYFATMRIPLLEGRDFNQFDNESSPRVAIVNQAMAERFWPGIDAIGRQFTIGDDAAHTVAVVGIVRNSRNYDFAGAFEPYFYMPFTQHFASALTLQVRTPSPETAVPKITSVAHTLAPTMPIFNVQSMSSALDGMNGTLPLRLGATLTVCLGMLGLILATVGIYGVISYAASQRNHEIGIRLALGARPVEILRLILQKALIILSLGIVLGLFAAFFLSQSLTDFLVGVHPVDALTYVSASLFLGLVVVLASLIPARRATRVNPMVALRYD